MQELETLLTSLIEKGWKPWGIDWDDIELLTLDMNSKNIYIWYMDYSNPEEEHYDQKFKTFRELASMESWLWDFVVKNNLQWEWKEWTFNISFWPEWPDAGASFYYGTPEYRLIGSSLIPEEELGQFLFDNIIVEWTKTTEKKNA